MFRFFHISVLASLWRIISGEHLKMGDPKLDKLMYMLQGITKEFANPLTAVSYNYVWLFKLLNNVGILKSMKYYMANLDFTSEVVKNHKQKPIDGKLFFSMM